MPKLNARPPKYCKLNSQAVVYFSSKPHYLGRYGSPESHEAYSRIVAEIRTVHIAATPHDPCRHVPKTSQWSREETVMVSILD
jgi:hypothetical protein